MIPHLTPQSFADRQNGAPDNKNDKGNNIDVLQATISAINRAKLPYCQIAIVIGPA